MCSLDTVKATQGKTQSPLVQLEMIEALFDNYKVAFETTETLDVKSNIDKSNINEDSYAWRLRKVKGDITKITKQRRDEET